MTAEHITFAVLLIAGSIPLLHLLRRARTTTRVLSLIALVLLMVTAREWHLKTDKQRRSEAALLAASPTEGRPGGYVTSDSCQSCHPNEHASWHRTFHRTMTQRALPENLAPVITNQVFELNGHTYRIERVGDELWAEMPEPDEVQPRLVAGQKPAKPMVRRRLTLLTGSHNMQVFWVAASRPNAQLLFPFCYLIADQKWVPFHNTFLRDPAMPEAFQIWNNNCINCHSTAGQPRPNPGATLLSETRTGELGIGCESCHGPGEAHVRANQQPIRRYLQRSKSDPDPTIVNPAKLDHKASSQVCGQCHSIKWIPNGPQWREQGFAYLPGQDLDKTEPVVRPVRLDLQPWLREPLRREPRFVEDRYWKDGIVRVSGRDFSGMMESACYQKGELSCLSCHSMHTSDPRDMIKAKMETSEACFQCHQDYRNKIEEHTHHKAGSPGSDCYNCHMPHTVYGLLKGIRSHFIESPKVMTTLQTQRPLACNLCHLDKSLGWSARHLSEWYKHPLPPMSTDLDQVSYVALQSLKGDAGQRALMAWTLGWKPAQETSGTAWLPPILAQLMADPYSAVRYIAGRSMMNLPGFEQTRFDFMAAETNRNSVIDGVVELWSTRTNVAANPAMFISGPGRIDYEKWRQILRQRDNKSIDLQE